MKTKKSYLKSANHLVLRPIALILLALGFINCTKTMQDEDGHAPYQGLQLALRLEN